MFTNLMNSHPLAARVLFIMLPGTDRSCHSKHLLFGKLAYTNPHPGAPDARDVRQWTAVGCSIRWASERAVRRIAAGTAPVVTPSIDW